MHVFRRFLISEVIDHLNKIKDMSIYQRTVSENPLRKSTTEVLNNPNGEIDLDAELLSMRSGEILTQRQSTQNLQNTITEDFKFHTLTSGA